MTRSDQNSVRKDRSRLRWHKHLALAGGIMAVAFGLRSAFLKRPQVPVVWDAAGYHIQARTFLSAFKGFSDRPFFEKEWRRAYDMASFKGEIYPLFLSLVYYLGGESAEAGRTAQAVLDSLACLLVYLISLHIFRRWKIGLAAGLLCAFYIPLIFSVGRLLTETLGIFLVLLMVWLLYRGISRKGHVIFVLAGLVTALAMVCRTAFQYIVPFVLAGVYLSFLGEKKSRVLVRIGLYLFGVALLIAPRLHYTGKIYDSPLLSGSWRNGEAIYGGLHPETQGFQTESVRPSAELTEVLERAGRRRIEQSDYYRAYLMFIARYPVRSAAILGSKVYSFWNRPYNDFHQTFLMPWDIFVSIHRLLLLFSLFGIVLSWRYRPRNWLFLFVLAYLAAVALFADLEIRYGLPAMPFLLVMSALAFDTLFRAGRKALSGERALRIAPYLLGCGLLFLLYRFLSIARIRQFLPSAGVNFSRIVTVVLFALFWLSVIPLVYRLGRGLFSPRFSLATAGLPVLAVLASAYSYSWINPYWHEWSARLAEPGQIVRQVIELPPDIENYRKVDLLIDMQSGTGQGFDLDVTVDGKLARRFSRGLTMDWDHYIRTRRAFNVYLQHHRLRLGDLKQWFTIPLSLEDLEGKDKITVEIFISRTAGGAGDYVDVFGDYLPDGRPLFFQGPTWSRAPADLSAYKYAVEDDWRLWTREEIRAPVTSSFYDGKEWSDEDFSASSGTQDGRYRVFLELSRRVRTDAAPPVEITPGDLITNRAATPAHRVQTWMVIPDKKKSDRLVIEMAHAAPGEEGGFWFVAYADTTGDGHPDRLLGRSEYFTAEKAGQWSRWEFQSDQKLLFVGNTWEQPTRVYYGPGEWPHDILGSTMFYTNSPAAIPRMALSGTISNLTVYFSEE